MKTNFLLSLFVLAFKSFLNLFSQIVSVNGRQLFVGGKRNHINGICYSRGGTGCSNQDITIMQEATINTIRTYNPMLDYCH